jgi:hypothetical protein
VRSAFSWFKFVKMNSAQQAKEISNFKNTKENLLRANSTMWFNKICKIDQFAIKTVYKCI